MKDDNGNEVDMTKGAKIGLIIWLILAAIYVIGMTWRLFQPK